MPAHRPDTNTANLQTSRADAASMVAAKLANLENGGDRKSDQSANLQSDVITRSAAAQMLNVSERSVNTAKAVQASQKAGFFYAKKIVKTYQYAIGYSNYLDSFILLW